MLDELVAEVVHGDADHDQGNDGDQAVHEVGHGDGPFIVGCRYRGVKYCDTRL